MLFQTSDSDVYTLAKMLYRYGLSPKTLKDDISTKLQNFLKIYEYQARGKFFTNYDQFLQIIGLDKTPYKFQDYLSELNLNQEFKDEFIKAVIAGIYNQDSDINSVAGIVSLIAVFSDSYKVGEGNREVVRNNMKSVTQFQQKVQNITKNEHGRYLVNGQDEYEVVVIASLLSYSNISFYGLDKQIEFEEKDGQDAYIYIIAAEGVIKSAFVKGEEILPNAILIIDNESDLKEIGLICEACFEGKNVYKLQAQAKIDVGKYFYNYKILHGKHWKPAYPRLIPGKSVQIELDKNLYYLNSMEYVASCMEMEIISAKNIANKILHDFYTLGPQHDDL
ncbi:Prenylcysteine oxidase-like [Paramecium bursaria]